MFEEAWIYKAMIAVGQGGIVPGTRRDALWKECNTVKQGERTCLEANLVTVVVLPGCGFGSLCAL